MGPRLPLLALSLALPPPWLLADGGGGSAAGDELGELTSWLTEGGADLSAVTVGAGVSGERGVLTTRALDAGDVILRVPVPKAINVGPMSVTASEAAVKLLREQHKRRGTRLPYVRSLPTHCHALDTWPEPAMAALPGPLRQASAERRQWTRRVYEESVRGKERLFGGHAVTLEEFTHATCLVSSRTLGVANSNGDTVKFLIPFLDLVNHDRAKGSANQVRLAAKPGEEERGPAFIELVAGSGLEAGAEVFISYGDGQLLTPDETLAHYGFVEDFAPSLCTLDRSETELQVRTKRNGCAETVGA